MANSTVQAMPLQAQGQSGRAIQVVIVGD